MPQYRQCSYLPLLMRGQTKVGELGGTVGQTASISRMSSTHSSLAVRWVVLRWSATLNSNVKHLDLGVPYI